MRGGFLDLGPVSVLAPGPLLRLWPGGPPAGDEPWLRARPHSLAPVPEVETAFDGDARPAVPRGPRRLEGVRAVGADGALFDAGGRLVWESTSGRESVAGKMQLPRAITLLRRPERVAGPASLLCAYRADNYYHFLVDVLLRVESLGAAEEVQHILPRGATAWQREFAALLGLRTRSVELGTRTQIAFDELVFAPFLGVKHPVSEMTFYPRDALAGLSRRLREGARAERGSRRLFVSRREANRRRLTNESDVEALLRGRGFETIVPGAMTVVEQVRAFAAAEAVVAPHGAALANLVFAPEGSTVVEILADDNPNAVYYTLADTLGQSYWYLPGRPAHGAGPLDYSVDAGLLEATLDAAGL